MGKLLEWVRRGQTLCGSCRAPLTTGQANFCSTDCAAEADSWWDDIR